MSIKHNPGQIERNTAAGNLIYRWAHDPSNTVFVDIGSWNGKGTTQCIMDALIKRFDDCVCYSLETNREFHLIAKEYWDSRLQGYNSMISSRLQLMHGRIIEPEEVPSLEEVMKSKHSHNQWPRFYKEFFDAVDDGCPNVMNTLPESIDVLILDGGEFTTYAEYQKLKDRSRIIFCDDSSKYKCEKIRAELLEDKNFKVIVDEPTDRNGFCAFERVE